MARVWLHGTGEDEGYDHHQDTIARARSLEEIEPFLSDDELADLEEIYPDRQFWVWGSEPNPDRSPQNDSKVKSWSRLGIGEPVLFSWSREFRSVANVTYKTRNEEAAEYLWNRDEDTGETWEYMFFLDEPRRFRLPCEDFNQAVGYSPNDYPQGLRRMNPDASARALAKFDFESDRPLNPVSDDEFEKAVDQLEELGELDAQRASYSRVEQKRIRQHWFGGQDEVDCGLCGRAFPTELLIAAHIKRRSTCSREERLDYVNNTMPLCTLGCDELFERGYLVVAGGRVEEHPKRPATLNVRRYVSELEGQSCPHWSETSAKYFRWHRRYHEYSE